MANTESPTPKQMREAIERLAAELDYYHPDRAIIYYAMGWYGIGKDGEE